MKNHYNANKINWMNARPSKRQYRWLALALSFSVSPLLLGFIFWPVSFISFVGVAIGIIGIIVGIVNISKGRKHMGSLILSIIATLLPFIWCWCLFSLAERGAIELFL